MALSNVSTRTSSELMKILPLILVLSFLHNGNAREVNSCKNEYNQVVDSIQLLVFLESLQHKALSLLGPQNFDPKHYTDLPLLFNISETSIALQKYGNNNESFSKFVRQYFADPGSDLVSVSSSDFKAEPNGFLPKVKNKEVMNWALRIHSLWNMLTRKVSKAVSQHPDQHTLLALPYNVVVPGSRFREVYYWDSYWIIRGLLASKMYKTAKNVLNNLLLMVAKYGFVLNGSRAYYTNRSQPPLLSAMVEAVYKKTQDIDLLRNALPYLLVEHTFWNSGVHKVTVRDSHGIDHVLSRYYAKWNKPRPESATIDAETAAGLTEKGSKFQYREIATTAETGWDFSSRWMGDKKSLKTLSTTRIIPVDLNIFLLQMELNIAFFAKELGETFVVTQFTEASKARKLAIDSILWNEEMGQWVDYWLDTCSNENNDVALQQKQFQTMCCFYNTTVMRFQDFYFWDEGNQKTNIFASNFFPLWMDSFHSDYARVEKVIHKFNTSGLLLEAGISTSLLNTGQQWDFPNGWAPIQHIIIEGIAKHGSENSKHLAEDIARRWLRTNYGTFRKTQQMHEKYDVTECGKIGGGGEYTAQTGFGWTNGVVLALLEEFGWPENMHIGCRGAPCSHRA